jgi:iron complex outermembrane receptor protein
LHALAAGFDAFAANGLYGTVTYYYSGKVPLNDANTAYAKAYDLLGLKIGYEKVIKDKASFQLFTGVENLLNQTYSLGNDINGFGGRYYNAAPGRNYYVGVSFHLDYKNSQ